MEEEKAIIWVSQILIPLFISDKVHAFLGLFHRSSKKPEQLKKLFPSYHRCKSRALEDKIFELGFMSSLQHVFHSSTTIKNEAYINWLDKAEKKNEQFWKDQGIYDLIHLSRVGPKYNSNMLISTILFWEGSTNTFHLRCGFR